LRLLFDYLFNYLPSTFLIPYFSFCLTFLLSVCLSIFLFFFLSFFLYIETAICKVTKVPYVWPETESPPRPRLQLTPKRTSNFVFFISHQKLFLYNLNYRGLCRVIFQEAKRPFFSFFKSDFLVLQTNKTMAIFQS